MLGRRPVVKSCLRQIRRKASKDGKRLVLKVDFGSGGIENTKQTSCQVCFELPVKKARSGAFACETTRSDINPPRVVSNKSDDLIR
jgi:hypothetical protein